LNFKVSKTGVVVLALHAVRMGMGYPETESRRAGYFNNQHKHTRKFPLPDSWTILSSLNLEEE
jgi:hypothetical protein